MHLFSDLFLGGWVVGWVGGLGAGDGGGGDGGGVGATDFSWVGPTFCSFLVLPARWERKHVLGHHAMPHSLICPSLAYTGTVAR